MRLSSLFARNAAVRHSRHVSVSEPKRVRVKALSGSSRPQTLHVLVSIMSLGGYIFYQIVLGLEALGLRENLHQKMTVII